MICFSPQTASVIIGLPLRGELAFASDIFICTRRRDALGGVPQRQVFAFSAHTGGTDMSNLNIIGRQFRHSILLGILLLSACMSKPRNDISVHAFASAVPQQVGGATIVPVEISDNHIFLQARVNNSPLFWFILDSGAEDLLLDTEQANALGLSSTSRSWAGGAGENKYDIAYVGGAMLRLSDLQLENLTLSVTSLSTVGLYDGRAVDGIIGYHLLSRYTVEIDYAARVVRLYDPQHYRYSGTGESIPIEMLGKTPVVNALVRLPAREPVRARLMLDTGAPGELILNSPFVEAHRLLDSNLRTIHDPASVGLGGNSDILLGRAESLQVGRFELAHPIVGFARDKGGAFARTDVDGVVGGEVLRRFKVIFDYSRKRLILEPNEHFGESFTGSISGLSLRAEDADFRTFVVQRVLENSPAAEAGLRAGDRILSVDGQPAASLTLSQIKQDFRRAGSEYWLSVQRGQRTLRVKIKPRELI
jgi:hypothetical protein